MKDLFDSTNWLGYAAAVVLILVSFAAVFFSTNSAPPQRAVQLPPIAAADIKPGFVGKQPFGLWTLVCQNLKTPEATAEGATPPKRFCRTNALMKVRGPNNAILLAAGFNVIMIDTQPKAGILFRLPPSAGAADSANFSIDKNTMFKAPLRCTAKECLLQGALPPDALEQMRSGRTLSVVYTVLDREKKPRKVRVDQLLHGFRQSYDAMARAMAT